MKTYRDYLAESKKTFSYRVKVADCDLTPEIREKLESTLDAYQLINITKPKSMPITRYREFPTLGPVSCNQFEVEFNYPCLADQVRQTIHAGTGIPLQHIFVVDPAVDQMDADPVSNQEDGAVLGKDLPKSDGSAQDVVGDKHVSSLLKELGKDKYNGGEQYKGVNDDILAKSVPAEKAAKTSDQYPQNTTSVLGAHKVKTPSPKGK